MITEAGSRTASPALGAGGALLLLAGAVGPGLPGWLAYLMPIALAMMLFWCGVASGIRTPQRVRPAWYRDSRRSGRGHS